MPTPAFVALGDIHLDRYIWRSRRTVTGDALMGFRAFLDHAIRLRVPAVVVGDLFDSSDPDPEVVEWFRREAERFHAQNLPLYCLQGNHDKQPVPWYIASSPYPIHIGGGKLQEINGVRCAGFDFASRDVIEKQMAELVNRPVGEIQCLFLHQAVKQALRFEGAWNCDLDWVPDGIPLCVMGDIHKTQEYPMRNGGKAWYTGAGHPRSIEEIGPKWCLVVNQDLTVDQLPIPSRQIERFTFTTGVPGVDQLARVGEWIAQVTKRDDPLQPICWLSFTDGQDNAVSEVVRMCGDQVMVVQVPLVFRQESPGELDARSADQAAVPTLESLLGGFINPSKEPFAYQLALDLIDPTAKPQERLVAQRDRFLAGA